MLLFKMAVIMNIILLFITVILNIIYFIIVESNWRLIKITWAINSLIILWLLFSYPYYYNPIIFQNRLTILSLFTIMIFTGTVGAFARIIGEGCDIKIEFRDKIKKWRPQWKPKKH